MRVDDLISERTIGEVRSLWDVENLLDGGLGQLAGSGRPEFTKDSEKGRLAASVRSGDKQVHARLDLEVHFRNELITVGRVNRDILEDDVIRENNLSTLS